jgi:hypothetical protein
VSYFLARAFPPFLPILRRNSRTSSPAASFFGTPRVYNLAARLSSSFCWMIRPEQTLQAIARYEHAPPQPAYRQLFQGNQPIDRPYTHASTRAASTLLKASTSGTRSKTDVSSAIAVPPLFGSRVPFASLPYRGSPILLWAAQSHGTYIDLSCASNTLWAGPYNCGLLGLRRGRRDCRG